MKKTKKGEKEIDIRPMIYKMEAEKGVIFMRVATGSAANLKPEAVIRAYMESRGETLPDFALLVTRTEVFADTGTDGNHFFVPLEAFGEDIE